ERNWQAIRGFGLVQGRSKTRETEEAGQQATGAERHHLELDVLPMQLSHLGAHVRYPVDQPKVERLGRRPEGAREQLGIETIEPCRAPVLDDADEDVMDVLLDRLQPRHILR